MGENRRAFGCPNENVFALVCAVCFDERLLMLRRSSAPPPPPSVNVGDVGEREVPFGVGERSRVCPSCTGEPRSTPDIADGGRYSTEPRVVFGPSR